MEQSHNLLTLMFKNEKLMANLYSHFAERYTGFSDFWERLKVEEDIHAQLLEGLIKRHEEGKVLCKVDMTKMMELYEAVQRLTDLYLVIEAHSDLVTFEEAVQLTVIFESQIMEEANLYVESADTHTMKVLRQVFKAETGAHIQRVREFAEENEIDTPIETDLTRITQRLMDRVREYASGVALDDLLMNRITEAA